MYKFRSLSDKCPMIFLSLFFHISLQVRLFFVAKGNLKCSDLKMLWREESEKFSLCDTLNCIVKLKPFQFRKDSTSPRMTKNRYKFYNAT